MNSTLLASSISPWAQALAILFIVVCLALIILVLLQKGKGSGLSAAFGGAGGQSAFGSKTGDVFTWATIVVVAMFLLLAMILTMSYVPSRADEHMAPAMSSPPGAALPPAPTAGTDIPLTDTGADAAGSPSPAGADDTTVPSSDAGAPSETPEPVAPAD